MIRDVGNGNYAVVFEQVVSESTGHGKARHVLMG